jgi:hypothetical protein
MSQSIAIAAADLPSSRSCLVCVICFVVSLGLRPNFTPLRCASSHHLHLHFLHRIIAAVEIHIFFVEVDGYAQAGNFGVQFLKVL